MSLTVLDNATSAIVAAVVNGSSAVSTTVLPAGSGGTNSASKAASLESAGHNYTWIMVTAITLTIFTLLLAVAVFLCRWYQGHSRRTMFSSVNQPNDYDNASSTNYANSGPTSSAGLVKMTSNASTQPDQSSEHCNVHSPTSLQTLPQGLLLNGRNQANQEARNWKLDKFFSSMPAPRPLQPPQPQSMSDLTSLDASRLAQDFLPRQMLSPSAPPPPPSLASRSGTMPPASLPPLSHRPATAENLDELQHIRLVIDRSFAIMTNYVNDEIDKKLQTLTETLQTNSDWQQPDHSPSSSRHNTASDCQHSP